MTKKLTSPAIVATPARVEFDFEKYSKQLDDYIADYNLVVTPETSAGS